MTAAAPVSLHENIVLELLEGFVYTRDIDRAGSTLVMMLGKLRAGAEFVGHTWLDVKEKEQLYTRFASAIVALITDPDFHFSDEGFRKLGALHSMLEAIFEVSVFENSDHAATGLIMEPLERDPNRWQFRDVECMAKFLLLYCLGSNIEMRPDTLFEKAPDVAISVYLGMLAHACVLTPRAHALRETLLGCGRYFEHLRVPAVLLPALQDAYMYASYGTRPDRHTVKRHFTTMLTRTLASEIDLPTVAELRATRATRPERPTVLVPIEWFSSFHAMYRCYAPSVAQLRERFRLVACARETDLDAPARALFDELLPIPEGDVILSDMVRRIRRLAPDIVYYPSIGMAFYWVALASVRLAPIQVFTPGHPATTGSPAIDYVITEEGIGAPEVFDERVIQLPRGGFQFTERADAGEYRVREPRIDPDVVKVAVPANSMKLNVPFLECLKRIAERAQTRVEYHFFPNQIGLGHWQVRKRLIEWFPNCVAWMRSGYAEYLERIADCDLHLCSFPFGGANSNIDSMLVGLPLVTLAGREPHEANDAEMLRRVGLPGLIAETVEDYEELALLLIDSSPARANCAAELARADIRTEFFGPRRGAAEGAFGRAMWHIYENHEAMQRGEAHVIPWSAFTEI